MTKVKSNAPRGGPSKTTHKHTKFSVDGDESDDGMSLNLQRREILDRNSKLKGKVLHCKMYTYITTFNARTSRTENKRKELFHCFDSQSITILGVIDHKIVHNERSDDDIVYNQVNSSLFITSSAWRNDVNAAVGGVGIMINKRVSSVLSEVIQWNESIITATFEGNPKTTIIVHYSPVEGDDEAEQHNQLSSAVKQVPKHNILIVLGDFNAHLEKNLAKHSYHETGNANGKLVNNFSKNLTYLLLMHIFKRNLRSSGLIYLI